MIETKGVPLEEQFDKKWMDAHYGLKPSHCEWAGHMVEAIMWAMTPKTVIDLGCGACNFANVFNDYECRVLAVDGSKHAKETANDGVEFLLWDLRESLRLDRKFDLVLCVELIEHVEAEFEDTILNTMVEHAAGWFVFTGAQPGQGGKGHVNCREVMYWEKKLKEIGFDLLPELTRKIQKQWRENKVRWYYVEGLIVGRRRNGI